MEASSTTVNISGNLPTDLQSPDVVVEVKHTHGPNFGRYVVECPKCVQQYPDGPPRKTRKAKPSLEAENAALKAQLAQVLAAKTGITSTENATDQLVQLMLADQAEKLNEREAEKIRRALAREQDLISAKAMEKQKRDNEQYCETVYQHKKENGRTAIFQSQVHNDGMVHPFCSRCFKTFPPRRPHQEQMSTAVEA